MRALISTRLSRAASIHATIPASGSPGYTAAVGDLAAAAGRTPVIKPLRKIVYQAVPTSLFTSVPAPDEGPRKREPDVKWFFQPRPDGDGATHDEDDSAPGLISLPAELLQRHGAVVLDPGKAAAVNGYPTPQSTVYRVRTLLVPGDQLQDSQLVTALNGVLGGVNMMLIPPEPDEDMAGDGEVMEVLRQLPRPAVLVPAKDATVPVVVDAWVALQALRAAAAAPKHPEHPEITKAAVQRIELEHLMCASAINGSPIDGGGGGIPGGSGNGNGVAGPSSTDSYLFNGGDARTPVAMVMEPPARRSASQCASDYGRRAVVALLDTGAREQEEWLDVRAKPGGGYETVADGFVAVDPSLQHAIRVEGELAASHGDRPRQVIRDPWDGPVSDDPLVGEIRLGDRSRGVRSRNHPAGRARRLRTGRAGHAQRWRRQPGRPHVCAPPPGEADRAGQAGRHCRTGRRGFAVAGLLQRVTARRSRSPPGCTR